MEDETKSNPERSVRKITKRTINEMFNPTRQIARRELAALISERLRNPALPSRDFVFLVNYYMELKNMHTNIGGRKPSKRTAKMPVEFTEEADLHEMVKQMEDERKGAN